MSEFIFIFIFIVCVCMFLVHTCGLDFPQLEIPEVSETLPGRKRADSEENWRQKLEQGSPQTGNSIIYKEININPVCRLRYIFILVTGLKMQLFHFSTKTWWRCWNKPVFIQLNLVLVWFIRHLVALHEWSSDHQEKAQWLKMINDTKSRVLVGPRLACVLGHDTVMMCCRQVLHMEECWLSVN